MKNLQFIEFSETEVLQVAISNEGGGSGNSATTPLIAADDNAMPQMISNDGEGKRRTFPIMEAISGGRSVGNGRSIGTGV